MSGNMRCELSISEEWVPKYPGEAECAFRKQPVAQFQVAWHIIAALFRYVGPKLFDFRLKYLWISNMGGRWILACMRTRQPPTPAEDYCKNCEIVSTDK